MIKIISLQPLFTLIFCFVSALNLVAQTNCQPPAPILAARQNIFSEEQEGYLGDAIAEQIQRDFRLVEDETVVKNLQRIGLRVTKHLPPNKLNFRFFVIESPDANAFVLPGGRIYVTRKLITFVQSEDELAGVLAHEMGHMVARQGGSDMTRLFNEILKVSTVTDRQDIFTKYNQMVDNAARNSKAFSKLANHEDKDQIVADQIGLFALAGAGYEPQAFSRFFDRLADTKGKTGNFFSDLFGVTNPDAKRLREMIKTFGSLPTACIEARTNVSDEEFKKWQQVVINYNYNVGKKAALHNVITKTVLAPPLRGEITHLRFSPDGKYVLAQDDSGISVLTREPFKTLFRITAPEATNAQFTPDSQNIVFYNSDLRVENWSVAEQKVIVVNEMFLRTKCVQSVLAPDGKTLACLDGDMNLNLHEVATGNIIFQKKNFYQPSGFDLLSSFLTALINSDDSDDFEFDWINMEFSPDCRFFAAGKRSTSLVAVGPGISLATDNTAIGFDLQTKAPVQLKGNIKKMIAANFAFIAPDRIIGRNIEDQKKSGILAFPSGTPIEQFEMFPGKLTAPAKGDYLLVRPFGQHKVGVMDLKTKTGIKANKNTAFDMYDQFFVSERMNGELGLYGTAKNDVVAVVNLPTNDLGRLRAATISSDLNWLAVSERTRGAIWDLSKGDRAFYLRGFRGAYADQNLVYADFPKADPLPRQIGILDAAKKNGANGATITENRARQFGQFMMTTKPAKKDGGYSENVLLELQNVRDLSPIWSKEFTKEAPRVWLEPHENSLVLSWLVSSKAAQSEIKNDPALKQKIGNKKEQEGDYFLHVYDAKSGNLRGKLVIETGKGSFRVSNFFAVNDYVIASDTENRVQIYSLSTGERKGQVFGRRAEANLKTGLLSVENESGQLIIYDLATLQKRDEFNFASPIALTRFSEDGKKLFVLTGNQTTYLLDVSSLSATK